MLNVLFRQIVISPFLGVKKGHVHSTHREKSSQKSLCNYYSLFKMPTIYPGPVCPSFLQLEDVFCFGGLYLDLLLRFRHNKQVSRAFREVGLLLIVFTCIAANFPIRFSATIPGCRSFIFAILPIVDHFLVGDVRGTAPHIRLFVNCGTHA